MKRVMIFSAVLLLPIATHAGEKISGTIFYVVDQQAWETGEDTGYWIWHGRGITHSTEGPFGTFPTECHGAGFWDANGSWGEGICVDGSGDDTRIGHWKKDKGEEVGRWEFVSGTGKFAGIKGQGTYTPTPLPGNRHVSEFEGEVTLPE